MGAVLFYSAVILSLSSLLLIVYNSKVLLLGTICSDNAFSRQPHHLRLAFGAHHLGEGPYPLDRHEVRMDVAEIIVHPEFRP